MTSSIRSNSAIQNGAFVLWGLLQRELPKEQFSHLLEPLSRIATKEVKLDEQEVAFIANSNQNTLDSIQRKIIEITSLMEQLKNGAQQTCIPEARILEQK